MSTLLKPAFEHPKLARSFLLLGLGGFLFSLISCVNGPLFFLGGFLVLAWWSCIFVMDGWVYRQRGESLLITFPKRFFFLCFWSLVFCSFWALVHRGEMGLSRFLPFLSHGVGLFPPAWPVVSLLFFLSVIPMFFELTDLLDTSGIFRSVDGAALGRVRRTPVLVAGGVCLVLSMIWPSTLFPLLWAAPGLLLDPFNERWGAESLLSDVRLGNYRRFGLLLLSGLSFVVLCQSVVFFGGVREGMGASLRIPLVWYLLFLPLALSAFVSSVTLVTLWERSRVWVRGLLILAGAGIVLFSFSFGGFNFL